MIRQGTPEWHLQRIGYFTSSEVGKLLVKSKSQDKVFGATAETYILEVAAERDLNERFLDIESGAFGLYLERVEAKSRAMRWGNEMEATARKAYAERTGYEVEEAEFIACNNYYGDSSDGTCRDRATGEIVGVLEIKCPNPATHKAYRQLATPEELKRTNPGYYCQCQMHMVAHGVGWCDFVSFDPMCREPIHILRIPRDEKFIEEITARIELANQHIESLK